MKSIPSIPGLLTMKSGQLLQSGILGQSDNPVDVSGLPKGWYVLSVLAPDGQQHPLPFIKQ